MAIIKHLTKEDYLTSTCKSKTFEDLGERLNELEEDLLLPLSVSLENEDGTFLVGTDKEGQTIDFEEGFAELEIHGKSEQETRKGHNMLNMPYTKENPLVHTSEKTDHYFITNYFVTLEAGKQYSFRYETDCERNGVAGDTVEAYLLKDKGYDFVISCPNKFTTFTPNESGDYYVRVDINELGKTYGFWDFQINEGLSTDYEQFGAMPSPDFPSEIKSVGEEVEVDGSIGKNKFNLYNENRYVQDYSVGVFEFDGETIKATPINGTTYYVYQYPFTLEVGKDYTISYTTTNRNNLYLDIYYGDINNNSHMSNVGEDGTTFTATQTDYVFKIVAYGNTETNIISNIQLEEGSVKTDYEPYQVLKEKRYKIGILSIGENMLPPLKEIGVSNNITFIDDHSIEFTHSKAFQGYTSKEFLLKKGTYTLCADLVENAAFCLEIPNEDYKQLKNTFTINENKMVRLRVGNPNVDVVSKAYKCRLVHGREQKTYSPYVSHKTTLLLKEPLRGLPNGVCDKVVTENGVTKIIRNVNKVVLNGSETWNTERGIHNYTALKNCSSKAIEPICSHFIARKNHSDLNIGECRFGGAEGSRNGNFIFRLEEVADNTRVKAWLSKNNITVFYQASTPTEEIIHQSINPYVYENGHLTIDSGEVQAPTVHTVNTNLKGTVEANAKEIELLKTNLDSLESFYDNYLLESDYAIAKTGLDIYFDYMVEE